MTNIIHVASAIQPLVPPSRFNHNLSHTPIVSCHQKRMCGFSHSWGVYKQMCHDTIKSTLDSIQVKTITQTIPLIDDTANLTTTIPSNSLKKL